MFHNKYVRLILLSNILLQLGIWARNYAILLYVSDISNNNPYYVSLISAAEYGPIFLFSIIGGTFADRWKPKLTMVWCDILSGVSIFGVLLALLYGSWHTVFLATLVSAVLSQFSQPSAMKLLKQHVKEDQLQQVMAMYQTIASLFLIIGPMLGTFVYQKFGVEFSIGVMGVMFMASALVLLFLPADEVKSVPVRRQAFTRELGKGLRYVWTNPALKRLALLFGFVGLGAGLVQPMMIFISTEQLGMGKDFLQWMTMASGAAMLLGGGVIMKLSAKFKPQTLLFMGLISSVVTTWGIGWSTIPALTLVLQAVSGLFFPCIHIGINTLILRNTTQEFTGRVNGVMTPMLTGLMVVGMSASGFMKANLSLMIVYAVSSLLYAAGVVFLVPLFKREKDNVTIAG
ncbi:MFS transporter [Paenibacillus gansuensis]|uniref:MFS transporter n=1 Tax=Paenibacillus gansuensis TaxID=306542 RepID=A0ABW5P9I4_9BACL